jgi:hypothetical protein
MTKQLINIGIRPNDGTGDTIREAFTKTNENFTELYSSLAADMSSFANVAFTGSYTDLINKPVLTTNTLTSGSNTVSLNLDGSLSVPGVIKSSNTTQTWTHNITAISVGSTNTVVTFDANEFGGPVVGQVIISAGGDTPEATGTWWYQAWDVNAVRLYNDQALSSPVDSTTWSVYEGGKTITNILSGTVTIGSAGNIWSFDAAGGMIAPGDIIVGSPPNTTGQEQHFIIDAQNYWTSIQWKNMTSLQTPTSTPFECQAQLLRVFGNDNTVTAWCNVNNPREELVALTAVRENGTQNGLMFSTSDGKIPDAPYNDGAGTRHDWIMGGDGRLTVPGIITGPGGMGGNLVLQAPESNVAILQNHLGYNSVIAEDNAVLVQTSPDSGTTTKSFVFGNDGSFTSIFFLAAQSEGAGGGYSFQNDGGYDTGMFSTQDGYVQFYANNQEVFNFNTDRVQINKPFTFDTAVRTGSGDPAYPTEIDLTKSINKLGDNTGSFYTLADGFEGQIMYLVRSHNVTDLSFTSIQVHVANAYYGLNQLANQVLYFNGDMITLIFTDGAWQQTGGSWD